MIQPAFKNRILRALDPTAILRLQLQSLDLPAGRSIESPGEPIRNLFFIEDGIGSGEFRATNARFIGESVSLLIDGIMHGILLERTDLTSGQAYSELGSLVLNALTK